jgi:hypothetical protein
MVGRAFAMLGFIRRLSFEFRNPYTLKSLYASFVRPKLEYARCVWSPFYDVRVDKVERGLRGLGWTDTPKCHEDKQIALRWSHDQ